MTDSNEKVIDVSIIKTKVDIWKFKVGFQDFNFSFLHQIQGVYKYEIYSIILPKSYLYTPCIW